MKHKTLNPLIYFMIIFSFITANEWIKSENKIIKKYSFRDNHSTYKIFTDSLHYIISNVSDENYSTKYSMIILINDKGEIEKKIELNNINNQILSGIKLKDGGFLFSGYSQLNSDYWTEIYVVKIDKNLNVVWEKNYSSTNYDNKGYSVIELNQNEYFILGHTKASKNNALILKIDSDGNEKWFSYLPDLNCSFATHMISNKKEEIIIAGQNSKELFVSKINANGQILWDYNYLNDNNSHRLYEIKNTSDGGMILVGNTTKNPKKKKDILIIKLSDDGKEEWVETLGNKSSEVAYDIEETKNLNYIIGGFALKDKKGKLYHSFIIKTDSLGKELERIDLDNLPSNKLYDLNINYNKKINNIIGTGDIINDNKSEILFIKFEKKLN